MGRRLDVMSYSQDGSVAGWLRPGDPRVGVARLSVFPSGTKEVSRERAT